jgi:hypothetical protein
MKEFRCVFTKLPCVGYFLNYLNYFSKEKAWTRSTVPLTESTGPVYGSLGFIKRWSSITGSVVQINSDKGYALVPILCVSSQMNDYVLIRWGGGALAVVGASSRQGAMATHQRWVAQRLRCSIHYGVSSYGFGTTRGARFTNLGQRRWAIPSGQRRRSSLWLGRCRGAPPVNLWLQERDEKLVGVHLSLLCRFNSSKWWRKWSSMAT